MIYDDEHHKVACRLLASLGISSIEASIDDDINSVADRRIGSKLLPMGMKARGKNAGDDYNLSAWSQSTGELPEYKNAGGKLYMYWMKTFHAIVQFPDQDILNGFLPDRWVPIFGEGTVKQLSNYAWVRRRSRGSEVQQGVVFVPNEVVIHRAIWALDEGLLFVDDAWISEVR